MWQGRKSSPQDKKAAFNRAVVRSWGPYREARQIWYRMSSRGLREEIALPWNIFILGSGSECVYPGNCVGEKMCDTPEVMCAGQPCLEA